jgi:hypothetical protein
MSRAQVSYGSRDTGKRKKAPTGAQIREEIRKLNLIAKSEFRRSFDEEAAVDLLLRLGLSEVRLYLEELLASEPDLKARALAARVRRRFGIVIHPRTVEKALVKKGRQTP